MRHFTPDNIDVLAVSAISAAAYLDACDQGGQTSQLDPRCYQACGKVLKEIFSMLDPAIHFPILIEQSAAAREVAESLRIGKLISISRLGYYPELSILLNRASV